MWCNVWSEESTGGGGGGGAAGQYPPQGGGGGLRTPKCSYGTMGFVGAWEILLEAYGSWNFF